MKILPVNLQTAFMLWSELINFRLYLLPQYKYIIRLHFCRILYNSYSYYCLFYVFLSNESFDDEPGNKMHLCHDANYLIQKYAHLSSTKIPIQYWVEFLSNIISHIVTLFDVFWVDSEKNQCFLSESGNKKTFMVWGELINS